MSYNDEKNTTQHVMDVIKSKKEVLVQKKQILKDYMQRLMFLKQKELEIQQLIRETDQYALDYGHSIEIEELELDNQIRNFFMKVTD